MKPSTALRNAALTALLALSWAGVFHQRARWITPHCLQNPTLCTPESVNPLDRMFLVNYSASADFWSFVTQDLAGVLALAVFGLAAWRRQRSNLFFYDAWILLQATATNGIFNECIRLWIQRPRPFVYLDPVAQGGAFAHYTSFYSGHTSFAALAGACAFLTAKREEFSSWAVGTVGFLALTLTFSTGSLRVFAGRHFISDTLVGALVGALIAWMINRLHQRYFPVR